MAQIENAREERGKQIAQIECQLFRVVDGYYKVKSQSIDRFYDVNNTIIGWKCNCPDHKFRGTKCKHIWAVQIIVLNTTILSKNKKTAAKSDSHRTGDDRT